MLFFKFLWLEFRFKSFLELHMHFKGFVCLRMRKLHAECQIRAAQTFYTPGIYAEGYIVFVFPFIRTYVCLFVHFFVRL